jgi:hypothetical protein
MLQLITDTAKAAGADIAHKAGGFSAMALWLTNAALCARFCEKQLTNICC